MTEQDRNILIVDDNPVNLDILRRMLHEFDYEVTTATSGSEALRIMDAAQPSLVILDVMMPDMDGYELCRRIKASTNARVPVIFVSALNDTLDKIKAFDVGADDYITKPFHLKEVIARVENQFNLYRRQWQIEQQRDKDRENYERLSQLKDDFMRSTTHDLKSPLAVTLGYTHLLETHELVMGNEELSMYVREIIRSSNRMLLLVDELLAFASIETDQAIRRQPVILSDYLRDVTQTHEMLAWQKQVKLTVQPPDETVTIELDPERMDRALGNLIANGIKYTPAGGAITVNAEIAGDDVLIHVTDNGLGIPEDALPRLFERYYRVQTDEHQAIEGTGLGLSIVQAIVAQHQGEVLVSSTPGKGSRFTIRLPLQS